MLDGAKKMAAPLVLAFLGIAATLLTPQVANSFDKVVVVDAVPQEQRKAHEERKAEIAREAEESRKKKLAWLYTVALRPDVPAENYREAMMEIYRINGDVRVEYFYNLRNELNNANLPENKRREIAISLRNLLRQTIKEVYQDPSRFDDSDNVVAIYNKKDGKYVLLWKDAEYWKGREKELLPPDPKKKSAPAGKFLQMNRN